MEIDIENVSNEGQKVNGDKEMEKGDGDGASKDRKGKQTRMVN
jgi:hypothetical protein